MPEGLEDCLLRHIFSIGLIFNNRQRGRVNPAFVRPDQLVKQVAITTPDALD
jgi:hypothetical protein